MSRTERTEELAEAIEAANLDANLPALMNETGFVGMTRDFAVPGVELWLGKCPFCRAGHAEVVVLDVGEHGKLPPTYRCLSADCSQARPGFAVDYLVALEGMSEWEAVRRLENRKPR